MTPPATTVPVLRHATREVLNLPPLERALVVFGTATKTAVNTDRWGRRESEGTTGHLEEMTVGEWAQRHPSHVAYVRTVEDADPGGPIPWWASSLPHAEGDRADKAA